MSWRLNVAIIKERERGKKVLKQTQWRMWIQSNQGTVPTKWPLLNGAEVKPYVMFHKLQYYRTFQLLIGPLSISEPFRTFNNLRTLKNL
jgi:hypothetical protein